MSRIRAFLPSLQWWLSHSAYCLYAHFVRRAMAISRNLFLSFPVLLSALWLVTASAETVPNGLSASQRLHRFLERVDTLSAHFEQTLFDETGQRLEDAWGIAYLARPKRFRWEYREPYRQTIVSDGKQVWFYDQELAQVIVKPWNAFTPETPAALLTLSRPPEEIFTIQNIASPRISTASEPARHWVRLIPKSRDATFTDIRLGFGKKTLEVMELSDNFGQITRLVFSKLVINEGLKLKLFSFTPPEGVDVVGED
uniref:Outer-membrane lipoprotein carrier protein n=1 Tax=Candidatus Kentrum sp. MB TaxID=2138164 RepID=A0A451B8Z7_9GAMM|nr:MAG: outer membrane lipoprotein carrier protein [Candidatus Kentron sp. MB]VFK74764.1 MAG: outer membrane lipoprotein carrier protein [Candidatus Kentron sp. MB]